MTAREMTTQQREEVNEVMVKQMNRMKARGQVDQGQVQELVKCMALRRVVQKWGGQVSEVGWAWIAEMKRRGDETVTRLERTYKGTMAIRHGWEECALARSGWDVELRRRYSDEELEEIERLQMLLAHMRRAVRGVRGNNNWGWEQENDLDTPMMGKGDMRQVQQSGKNHHKGAGSGTQLWKDVELLARCGMVGGHLGKAMQRLKQEPDQDMQVKVRWLGEVRRQQSWTIVEKEEGEEEKWGRKGSKAEGVEKKRKRGKTKGRRRGVLLDLFSGTQSARGLAKSKGLVYAPVDWEEEWWSPQQGHVVRAFEQDIGKVKPEELWTAVKEWLVRSRGVEATDELYIAIVWASPDCRTFSGLDSMQEEPCRFHNTETEQGVRKEPRRGLDGKLTEKGKLAVAADNMTRSALRIMSWARQRFGSELALENPQASLQMRPYMIKWEKELGLTKIVVHYCAYGHVYKKPTNIWTTRQGWTPKGNSGDGKCGGEGVCEAGYVNPETGYWKHLNAIGQEAWRLARGEEQEETKVVVPAGIHKEMFWGWKAQ